MKTNRLLIALIITSLHWQCTPGTPAVPGSPTTPRVDFDQESRQLMKELAPQIVGQWTLRQVQVKYVNRLGQNQLKLTKDTTFVNLATLTIVPAAVPRTSPVDTRRGEYDGTIQYRNKMYPVQFNMLASPDWIVNRTGPQTYFLFEYRFPNGAHVPEPEETFLKDLGLVGDNFTLQTTIGQPIMVWRGLNQGVERVELVRQ